MWDILSLWFTGLTATRSRWLELRREIKITNHPIHPMCETRLWVHYLRPPPPSPPLRSQHALLSKNNNIAYWYVWWSPYDMSINHRALAWSKDYDLNTILTFSVNKTTPPSLTFSYFPLFYYIFLQVGLTPQVRSFNKVDLSWDLGKNWTSVCKP